MIDGIRPLLRARGGLPEFAGAAGPEMKDPVNPSLIVVAIATGEEFGERGVGDGQMGGPHPLKPYERGFRVPLDDESRRRLGLAAFENFRKYGLKGRRALYHGVDDDVVDGGGVPGFVGIAFQTEPSIDPRRFAIP